MMEAGWVPLSAEVASEIPSQDEPINDQEPAESDLIDRQIPGWLSEGPSETGPIPEPELQDLVAEEALPEWVFENEPAVSSEDQLPPWLAETAGEEQSMEGRTSGEGEGLPDWLFVEESSQEVEKGQAAETPDWLMEEAPFKHPLQIMISRTSSL
ncbi:MAG: hypothetical protein A2Z16_13460 [Chloroflexi bacterium RBG_16_54_18]|nr:MAG: hypothetical protein A2Z16_13460 [Chloroflexi bacterium RBG_16_54_18]